MLFNDALGPRQVVCSRKVERVGIHHGQAGTGDARGANPFDHYPLAVLAIEIDGVAGRALDSACCTAAIETCCEEKRKPALSKPGRPHERCQETRPGEVVAHPRHRSRRLC